MSTAEVGLVTWFMVLAANSFADTPESSWFKIVAFMPEYAIKLRLKECGGKPMKIDM